jgi:hypothetical protein
VEGACRDGLVTTRVKCQFLMFAAYFCLNENVCLLKAQATCCLCVSMKSKSENKDGGKQYLREIMHSCDVSCGRAL